MIWQILGVMALVGANGFFVAFPIAFLVITFLHHVPRAAETVTVGGHSITVLESEPTRARRVLVEISTPSDLEPEG